MITIHITRKIENTAQYYFVFSPFNLEHFREYVLNRMPMKCNYIGSFICEQLPMDHASYYKISDFALWLNKNYKIPIERHKTICENDYINFVTLTEEQFLSIKTLFDKYINEFEQDNKIKEQAKKEVIQTSLF